MLGEQGSTASWRSAAPVLPCTGTARRLHTPMQWGCRAGPLPGAGCAPSIQQQATAGRPLANSSRPRWQTAVLGHLLSSASPSHLILEELGLVLATRQSLNKAKHLGRNGEKCQDRAMFLAADPPEPTSSHFEPCKVPQGSWGRGCSCFALPCQSPPLAPGTGTGLPQQRLQQLHLHQVSPAQREDCHRGPGQERGSWGGNGVIRGSLRLAEPSEIIEAIH